MRRLVRLGLLVFRDPLLLCGALYLLLWSDASGISSSIWPSSAACRSSK